MTSLLDLPQEILIRILCYLDLPDLASVTRVHSIIRNHGLTSWVLQYRFAVQAAAVEDNALCSLPIAERFKLLKSREQGWSNFQVSFRKTIPIIQQPSRVFRVAGGLLLFGDVNQKSIHYCKLPSSESESVAWSTIDIGQTILEVAVCPDEHDLLAAVTIKPHGESTETHVIEVILLQFSTGDQHPLPANPVIFVQEVQNAQPSICLDIVGNHLIMVTTVSDITFQTDPKDTVYVFDWKTDTAKVRVVAPNHTYRYVTFLTPSLFLLPNMWNNSLEIWSIPQNNELPLSPLPHSNPVLSLDLPRLSVHEIIVKLSCRAEPNPAFAETNSDRPFHASPESAIIVFTTLALSVRASPHIVSLSMFVHRSSLVKLLRETTEKHLYWDEWGPPVTRWFHTGGTASRWMMTSAGQRCVLSYFGNRQEGEDRAASIVLDFNPLNVKKMISKNGEDRRTRSFRTDKPPSLKSVVRVSIGLLRILRKINNKRDRKDAEAGSDSQSKVVTASTTIRHDAFKEPVESRLPYISIPCNGQPLEYAGLLMDEERLIGLRTDDNNRITGIEVLHMGTGKVPSL